MSVLVCVYAIAVAVVAVAVVIVSVARRVVLMRDGCVRRLAGLWTPSGCDALGEPGVSLLVDYDGNEHALEELLSMDYLRYEVVLVGNLAADCHLTRIVERYAMVEVGAPVIDERLQHSPRRLYRSRRRSYRRLVVVDTAAAHPSERMDCALAVRSYDHVLPVERGVRLSPDAVRVLVWRASESPEAEVVTAPVLTGDGVAGAVSELWSFFGWRAGEVALLDGDAVVAVGGFSTARGRGSVTRRIVKPLTAVGCRISRLGVAVGRNPHAVPPIGIVDLVGWHLLSYGVVLAIVGTPRMRLFALLGLVMLLLSGVTASVAARSFRRTSGSLRPWMHTLAAPLLAPFRIFLF